MMRGHDDTRFPEQELEPAERADYEGEPLNRAEYIAALVHLYRGESARALAWRNRLDTTTNWAILATVGILTFSFSNPQYAQETLITGMYANLVFMLHEARRFRFFDVWRSRVRMIEENFYGPILRRDLASPISRWGDRVADDLLHPKFKITMAQAIKARLIRNYSYILVFLLLAWLGRAAAFPRIHDIETRGIFDMGVFPWWVPAAMVALLYGALVLLVILTPRVKPPEKSYWLDPEHAGEEVPSLDV